MRGAPRGHCVGGAGAPVNFERRRRAAGPTKLASAALAARRWRQIIGGAPINKCRQRRSQIVGGGGAAGARI